MKQVKIKKLSLNNFKGIKQFSVDFGDETTRIYGDNATGKTTLVDAFTWLLFGKDSTDRKDFSIKNFDSNNNVEHKLDHEVYALFAVGEKEVEIKRIYREKWVTRRGSSEPELQGHETLFFWNDVPLQAGEFQNKVNELVSEQTFKMITSPFYFNTLKWQDRRNILTSIAGDVSDQEIASTNEAFLMIMDQLNDKSIEEYKRELAAKKKKLKDELKLIPARIDEVGRNTPEAKNWADIESQINELTKKIEAIDEKLLDSSKVSEDFFNKKQARQKHINDLKTKVSNFEDEARRTFSAKMKEKADAISDAKIEIEKINKRIKSVADDIKVINGRIDRYKQSQGNLREKWNKVNQEVFPGFNEGEFKCPTCKQDLPSETIESKKTEFKANFNSDKERRLKEISSEGLSYKSQIEAAGKEIEELEKLDFDTQIKQHEAVIAEWENVHLKSVQAILNEMAEYQPTKEELERFSNEPELKEPTVDNSELKTEKKQLEGERDELKKALALKSQIEAAEVRKNDLKKQEKEFSQQLAELEQSEFTLQEFTRTKVDMLESRINALFEGVKFRMFDTQLNGGLIECCDTLINGVPWADANNAARINAGISIINVLSKHYGEVAPIWIDNAESITSIIDTEAQKVELYVSKDHKELEVA